jgi:predicted dehydrogenase
MRAVEGEPDPFSVTLNLGEGKGFKEILFEKPEVPESNAIRDELAAFAKSIRENTEPEVTVRDGMRALEVAHLILEQINRQLI